MNTTFIIALSILLSGCQISNKDLLQNKLKSINDIWSLKTVFDTQEETEIFKELTYDKDLIVRSRAISILMTEIQNTEYVKQRILECIKNDTDLIYFNEKGMHVKNNRVFNFKEDNGEDGIYLFRSAFVLLFEFDESIVVDLFKFLKIDDLPLARESYAAIERIQKRKISIPFKKLWKNNSLISSLIKEIKDKILKGGNL